MSNTEVQQDIASDGYSIQGKSIGEAIKRQLETPFVTGTDVEWDRPFYVGDLAELRSQYLKWKARLPRIEPFFAIKSNPDPTAAKYLAALGVGFDCASQAEIEQVLDMGVDKDRIIYTHPYKNPSFLQYVAQQETPLMTFDSESELHKIKRIYPNAKLVIRILVDDKDSVIRLSRKSGVPLYEVEELLSLAKDLELNIVGVCFHVGSGCKNPNSYYDAVLRARQVFDQAKSFGFKMELLNVGGGFNESGITEGATFEKAAAVLGPAVDELFPSNDVRVIGEPGRYFVGSAYTLCLGIMGRRRAIIENEIDMDVIKKEKESNNYMYYINDGYFGSFGMMCLDPDRLNIKVLRKNGEYFYGKEINEDEKYPCTIWGTTCSSYDCVSKDTKLPVLNEGDWLYLSNAGAYSYVVASTFNGFDIPKIIYINSDKQ
ncbi:pyridoxal-dependent decarboxylase [Phascolomyces articulosus]|uniref:Pyridoxal-dependent decarboxylase n=1 Tax=Phascolomyces articulosus TaxID=60185 RepID=A0AAD5K8L7_9FUNG|nr:pyridoxal-dependent decarboxylase [Phascolomyces articulosus]